MEKDLVYDVGAHRGEDTAYYLFRGYRVVAVEADPELVSALRRRFAREIDAGRLSLAETAIAAVDGPTEFWVSEHHREWSSLERGKAGRRGVPCRSIQVPGRRFAALLREFGVPFYLKIDIEGADRLCLEDLDPADAPQHLSFEMCHLEDLLLLRQLGYDRFRCITQNDHRPLRFEPNRLRDSILRLLARVPRLDELLALPLRARRRLARALGPRRAAHARRRGLTGATAWYFPPGSSGPFGDDLPGEWRSLEQVAFDWLACRLGHTEIGAKRLRTWHDVHATRP